MNLLVKKLWQPIAIILAAIVVISCEDPGRIGLIIDEDNAILKTAFHDVALTANVVQFNPRKTSETANLQVGNYDSPYFGKITTKCYMQLSPGLFVDPAANAEYLRAEMTIGFTEITGPAPIDFLEQGIAIYQLAEPIDSTVTYTRIDERTLGPLMAEWDFAPLYDDTLRTDSTYILAVNDAVGADIFTKMKEDPSIFEDEADFNAYFNGIGFVGKSNSSHIFDLERPRIKITIYYNEFNSEGNPVERDYSINISSNGFYHITSDVAGTALGGIVADNSDYTPTDDNIYLQFGTLMAIRTDIQPFYDITDTIENLVLNKAEIVIGKVKPGTEYDRPPNILHVYFTDDINTWPITDQSDSATAGSNFITLQEQRGDQFVPPGIYGFTQNNFYDPDSLTYNIEMSYFFQNLYSGEYASSLEEEGQLLIFGESDAVFPNRSDSHSEVSSLVVNKDSIRLRLYYSYPNIQQTE